jgi:2-dehydro-3-deoxy-D-arabinonate dehydratase
MMIIYRTTAGLFAEHEAQHYRLEAGSIDDLCRQDDLASYLQSQMTDARYIAKPDTNDLLPPIGTQEVWASGVTYFRSRNARMEESKTAGGGDFYDRVYAAERPELFFKALPHKVVGPGQEVRIRRDATWSVPEPELVVLANKHGSIIGYSVGNDMSSRDIEGENPLYLPQAKVYDGSCALGPGVLISSDPLPPTTEIRLTIVRGDAEVFTGDTSLKELKRDPQTLVKFLFRDQTFATGSFLFTGTGIVPPDDFTLQQGDKISITIDLIGTLRNVVS